MRGISFLVRTAVADLVRALLIGALLSAAPVLLIGEYERTVRFAFYEAPTDHDALADWYRQLPSVRDVCVETTATGVTVEFVADGLFTKTAAPPLTELGYSLRSLVDDTAVLPRLGARLFLTVLVATQIGFLVVGLRRRARMRRRGEALPEGGRTRIGQQLLAGLAAGLLLFGFGQAYGWGLLHLRPDDWQDPSPWMDIGSVPPLARAGLVASSVVLAPVAEELFFRGLLFARFVVAGRTLFGACFSAVLFAGVHLDVWRSPALFVYGGVLALVYRRTGSLVAPVAAHATNNAAAMALLLA